MVDPTYPIYPLDIKVGKQITLDSQDGSIDICQHRQVILSLYNTQQESVFDIDEETDIIVCGGRIPKYGRILSSIPSTHDVVEMEQSNSDEERFNVEMKNFGYVRFEFWDADYRRERVVLLVEPKIRASNGTPIIGTLNLNVGESVRLTYYAGIKSEVQWLAASLIYSLSSSNGYATVITGVTPGSGDLIVNGLFSTTQTLPVVVS